MENPSINGWFGCTSILGNLHMIICFPGYTETFFLHPFFALHNHHEVTLPCSKSPWSLDTLRNCRLGSKSPRSANSQCLTKKSPFSLSFSWENHVFTSLHPSFLSASHIESIFGEEYHDSSFFQRFNPCFRKKRSWMNQTWCELLILIQLCWFVGRKVQYISG